MSKLNLNDQGTEGEGSGLAIGDLLSVMDTQKRSSEMASSITRRESALSAIYAALKPVDDVLRKGVAGTVTDVTAAAYNPATSNQMASEYRPIVEAWSLVFKGLYDYLAADLVEIKQAQASAQQAPVRSLLADSADSTVAAVALMQPTQTVSEPSAL